MTLVIKDDDDNNNNQLLTQTQLQSTGIQILQRHLQLSFCRKVSTYLRDHRFYKTNFIERTRHMAAERYFVLY